MEFERDFYTKIIVTIIPTNLVTNSLLFLVCPFIETKKSRSTIDFYKRIFLHVIPTRIIVPWMAVSLAPKN